MKTFKRLWENEEFEDAQMKLLNSSNPSDSLLAAAGTYLSKKHAVRQAAISHPNRLVRFIASYGYVTWHGTKEQVHADLVQHGFKKVIEWETSNGEMFHEYEHPSGLMNGGMSVDNTGAAQGQMGLL